MTDEQWLRRESAALLALLDTCEKPDTWTSIANDCVLEGSAERIYHHHLDPSAHSLEREENDAYAIQGTLLDDPPSPTFVTRLENAYKIAEQRLDEWKRHGYDFMSVFDPRFPGQLRMTIDVPPFLFASGTIIPNETAVSVVGSRACTPEGAQFAIDCARMLTKRGIGVIAGLAKGIDTFAHKTALADGGEPSRSSAPASTVSTRRRTATCRNASKTKGSCCPSSCRAPNRPDRRSRCVTRSCPAMASPPSSPTRTNTPALAYRLGRPRGTAARSSSTIRSWTARNGAANWPTSREYTW